MEVEPIKAPNLCIDCVYLRFHNKRLMDKAQVIHCAGDLDSYRDHLAEKVDNFSIATQDVNCPRQGMENAQISDEEIPGIMDPDLEVRLSQCQKYSSQQS